MSGVQCATERRVKAVLIPNAIITDIRSKVPTTSGHDEQGGLLLGYRKRGALELTSATFPGRWDRATPTLFKRSARGHRIFALREWLRSGHMIDWIGEWHTHPGGRAWPSSIDLRGWRATTRHTGKTMVFVIFDAGSHYVGLQSPDRRAVRMLRLTDSNGQYSLFA